MIGGPKGDGIACPACGRHDTSVRDTRPGLDVQRRRRICGACGNRFTTLEMSTPDYEGETIHDAIRLRGELASLSPGMRNHIRAVIRMAAIERGKREALQASVDREEP